jgi:D-alanyl-D-alanine carboxypeptidase
VGAAAALAAMAFAVAPASSEALLVIEADSGKVIHAENAGHPWYPASVTKLMTTYVTLRAVKEGRITLDTAVKVSTNAAAQQPVKMGFPVGTLVTIDNALKMLLVRSSNDMAVVLAEGVAGSIENFAGLMNDNARRLGMVSSSFVNPNGLPADDQITSARDLGILARALIREFPEYDYLWHIPAIKFGKTVMRNYNSLIGRYPGADGMKTGFICASGFNLVASATRNGKRMIAVVLGASSSQGRAMKAAQLLERGFSSNANALGWLAPSLGTVDAIEPISEAPPNLREDMCGAHRKRKATEDEDEAFGVTQNPDSAYGVFLASLRPKAKGEGKGADPVEDAGGHAPPVVVYTGPARKPGDPIPPEPSDLKPKKAAKPKGDAKTAATKPAGAKPTDIKPAAKNTDGTPKSAAQSDTAPAAKPKPKKPAAPKTTESTQTPPQAAQTR